MPRHSVTLTRRPSRLLHPQIQLTASFWSTMCDVKNEATLHSEEGEAADQPDGRAPVKGGGRGWVGPAAPPPPRGAEFLGEAPKKIFGLNELAPAKFFDRPKARKKIRPSLSRGRGGRGHPPPKWCSPDRRPCASTCMTGHDVRDPHVRYFKPIPTSNLVSIGMGAPRHVDTRPLLQDPGGRGGGSFVALASSGQHPPPPSPPTHIRKNFPQGRN